MADSKRKPRRAFKETADSPVGYDADRVEAAVREFLLGIGEDPDREGLRDTPGRIARSCA